MKRRENVYLYIICIENSGENPKVLHKCIPSVSIVTTTILIQLSGKREEMPHA